MSVILGTSATHVLRFVPPFGTGTGGVLSVCETIGLSLPLGDESRGKVLCWICGIVQRCLSYQ